MPGNYLVRSIDVRIIPHLVEVHQKSFRGFFLTFLGSKFIAELYEAIIQDPSGIGCLTLNDERVSGFVIGSTQPAGLYGRLLRKRWWRFSWAAFPTFIRNPGILPRLLRAFRKPTEELPAPKCSTLMSIAVDPDYQGKGLGKKLVSAFLEEARRRGLENVNLTTDADHNESVNTFYQSIGFKLVRSFTTAEGRSMNEYLISLPAVD